MQGLGGQLIDHLKYLEKQASFLACKNLLRSLGLYFLKLYIYILFFLILYIIKFGK